MDRALVRELVETGFLSTLSSYKLINGAKRDVEEITPLGPGVYMVTEVKRSRDGRYTISVSVKGERNLGDERELYISVVRPTIAQLVDEYLPNGIDWRTSFVVFELEQDDVLDLCDYREVTGSFAIDNVTLAIPEEMDEEDVSELRLSDSGIRERHEDIKFDSN